MKVLYLFLDGTRSPGVIRKVKSKIRFLNGLGLDVTGIVMNKNVEEYRYDNEEKIVYLPLKITPLPFFYNRRFIRNYRSYFATQSYLRQFYENLEREVAKHTFDSIVFRYPLSNKFLLRFCRKYPGKILFEHNSKELVEMEMDKAANPAMQYYINAEKKYASRVLSSARGLMGVGNEVTAYQVGRSGKSDMPHRVIANGIDVASLPLRTPPAGIAGELKLLFVTGSPSPWVGLDILLQGLADYSGEMKIKVYVVGPLNAEVVKRAEELRVTHLVEFTGEKKDKELDRYFDECHVALGTLAMQRVGLQEHSSLKVLEYAARGIPFVISYCDTNFEGLSDFQPFYDVQEYNGKTIDLGRVVQFANKVLTDRDHPKKMRDIAAVHFDFSAKMKQLKEFLETKT
ncbi:MAG TPA: glycosyltransferase [Bacteroidia bacterium]|nr:glycosyltransferase [Bacteroidia bacterium]